VVLILVLVRSGVIKTNDMRSTIGPLERPNNQVCLGTNGIQILDLLCCQFTRGRFRNHLWAKEYRRPREGFLRGSKGVRLLEFFGRSSK
jgi:hypothetical protein